MGRDNFAFYREFLKINYINNETAPMSRKTPLRSVVCSDA